MLKETYQKLEPKNYSRLEINNKKGVFLDERECYFIIKDIVRLELENQKLKKQLKSKKNIGYAIIFNNQIEDIIQFFLLDKKKAETKVKSLNKSKFYGEYKLKEIKL